MLYVEKCPKMYRILVKYVILPIISVTYFLCVWLWIIGCCWVTRLIISFLLSISRSSLCCGHRWECCTWSWATANIDFRSRTKWSRTTIDVYSGPEVSSTLCSTINNIIKTLKALMTKFNVVFLNFGITRNWAVLPALTWRQHSPLWAADVWTVLISNKKEQHQHTIVVLLWTI